MKKIISLCLAILMILSVIPVMAADAAYSVTGITDDECIYIHSGMTPVYTRTVGISSIDSVSKVTYAVDGTVKETATEAPFSWDMPLEDVNTHELVVTAYDSSDAAVYTSEAISYKVAYTVNKTVIGNDFDGKTAGTAITNDGAPFTYVFDGNGDVYNFTYENAPGRDGLAAKLTPKNGTTEQCALAFPITMPENKLVRIDFDMYRENGKTMDFQLWEGWYSGATETVFGTNYDATNVTNALAEGKWRKVSVLFDFSDGAYGSYELWVDDVKQKEKALSSPYPTLCWYFRSFGETYYIDNLNVSVTEPFSSKGDLVKGTEYKGSDFEVADAAGTAVTADNSIFTRTLSKELYPITYEAAPERTGKAVKVENKGSVDEVAVLAFSGVTAGTTIAKPANGLLRMDYDVYRVTGDYNDRMVIAESSWFGSTEEVLGYNGFAAATGDWCKVSILFDFNDGTNGSYQVTVDGNEVVAKTALKNNYNNICLYYISLGTYYIDNVSIYNVTPEEKPMMFGSYSYADSGDSLYVEGHVANFSSTEDDCVLIFTTYDAKGALVSAVSEPVSAAGKAIAGANKTIAKENNGKTAVKAKVFCWNSLTALQPIEKLGE